MSLLKILFSEQKFLQIATSFIINIMNFPKKSKFHTEALAFSDVRSLVDVMSVFETLIFKIFLKAVTTPNSDLFLFFAIFTPWICLLFT